MRRPLAVLLGGAALLVSSPVVAQTLDLLGGTQTYNNLLGFTVVENGTLNLTPSASFNFSGVLQDGAGILSLNKQGLEDITLSGLNTFSGETHIIGGTLFAGLDNTLSANSRLRVNSTLELQGFDQTVLGFYGSGVIRNQANGALTLTTANAAGVVSSFSGTIIEMGSNTIKLVKTGTGTQNLIGINNYGGGTAVLSGTLGYGNSASLGTGTVTFFGGTLSSIAAGTVLANDIVLTGNGRFAGTASEWSGLISGSGALIKAGGPLTLTNKNNSYSGGTLLYGNNLVLGGNHVLGSGTVTFINASKLQTANGIGVILDNAIQLDAQMFIDPPVGETLELHGVISGTKGIYVAGGPGTLLLSGNNDFGGTTYLTSGTLGVGTSSSLGSSLLYVSGDVTLKAYGPTVSLGTKIRIQDAILTVNTGAFAMSLTGPISDVSGSATGALIKTGSGTLTLAGTNNYSGGTTLKEGTLSVNANNRLGAIGGGLIFDGGNLRVTGTGFTTTARAITLLGNGGIDIQNGLNNFMLTQVVSGAGGLTKLGNGTLTLNASNLFTGGVVLTDGTLVVNDNAALGTGALLANFGTLQFGTVVKSLTLANAIDIAGTLTLDFVAPGTTIDLIGGDYMASGSTVVLNGLISGGGALVLANSGDLTLGHANGFTGGTTIDGSVVRILDDQAFGTGAIAAGNLAGLRNDSATAHAIGNDLSLDDAGISIGGSGALTLAGDISGSFGFYKVGTDTLTLSGSNTHAGEIIVNQGGLNIAGSNISDITVNAGATLGGTGSTTGIVTIAAFGILSPGNSPGVISFGTLVLANASISNFQLADPLGVGGSDRVDVTGDLTLGGTINIAALPGFTHGTYRLFNYGGALTDNNATIGTIPIGYALGNFALDRSVQSQVNLIVNTGGILYWDGTGPHADNVVNGGNGIWNAANTNWTDSTGTGSAAWANTTGIFAGAAGTVSVASLLGFDMLYFQTDGYVLSNGGGKLITNATGEIKVDPLATATVNAVITGANGLLKTGSGTLVLGGANTFSGGVDVSQGSLTIADNAALGTGTITFGSQVANSLAFAVDGLNVDNAVVLGSTTTIALSNGRIDKLSGIISGSTLKAAGSGTLQLSNVLNTFAGTSISASARVETTSNAALGAAAAAIVFTNGGGTLALDGAISSARAFDLSAAGGNIDAMTGDDTLSGIISGGGGLLSKNGAAQLTLAGVNTYTGGTKLLAGALRFTNAKSFGDGALTTSANTTLVVGDAGITLTTAINLVGATTLDVAGNVNFHQKGIIGGTGPLSIKDGSVYLDGANLHSGGTHVLNGAAIATNLKSLGTGAVSLDGGAALLANGSLSFINGVVLTGPSNQIGTADALTLTGVISGAGGFIKGGAGTLNLIGASTYAGDTSVNFGGLAVIGSLGGAGTVTVASGATLSGAGTIAGNVVIADGGHFAPGNSPGTITVGGLSLGSGSFLDYDLGLANVAGGTHNDLIIVTHDLKLAGHLTVTDSNAFGIGVYNLISYGGQLTGPGLLVIDSLPPLYHGSVQTLVPGKVNLIVSKAGFQTQYWDGGDMVGDGSIGGGTGTWSAGNTNWTTDVPSTLNASWQGGVASFGGTTGGTVTIAGAQAVEVLQFTTTGYVLAAGASGSLGLAPVSAIAMDAGISATISAPVTGTGSLAKQGAGTLTLSGSNTYSGGTTLTAGTLLVGGNSALGSGVVTLNGGTTLGSGAGVAYLSNAIHTSGLNTVDTIDVLTGGELQLAGVISGSALLKKSGAGLLNLIVANAYTGGTDITQGGVAIQTGTSLGSGQVKFADSTSLAALHDDLVVTNAVDLTGNVTFDQGATSLTLNSVVGGTGDLAANGAGTLVLNGLNTFHALFIQHGTVVLGTDLAAGSGLISISNDSVLAAGHTGLVLTNAINLAGSNRIDSDAGIFTLNGVVSGGTLDKRGTGELVLKVANTFTGGTELTKGIITVVNDRALGTGALTFTGGTTLKAGGGITLANAIVTAGTDTVDSGIYTLTLNGAVSGSGKIKKTGANTLALNHANTYTGGIDLTEGLIVVGNSTALGSGMLTMANDTILKAGVNNLALGNAIDLSGLGTINSANFAMTLNGVVSGSGTLQTAGNGSLTLNGANTYTGGTLLSSLALIIGHDTALGTGQLAMSGFAVLRARVDNLVVANDITTNNVSLLDAQGFTFTLGGIIDGAGQINTGGVGSLVLNGANTYTGGTVHQFGTIVVGHDTALGSGTALLYSDTSLAAGAANLTLANEFDLTLAGAGHAVSIDTRATILTLSGLVTGAAPLTKLSSGTLVLNGNNNYSGGTGLAQGTIIIGTDTALGGGALAMADGTTLQAGATGLVVANDIVTTGLGTIATQAYDLTLDGAITGAGGITKTGTGTLTLGGTSTYTGATALTAGKTLVDGTLGLTAVTVASGATLGGHGLISGSVDIADGGILAAGNSPGTLTVGALTLHDTSLVNFDLAEVNTIGGVYNDLTIVLGDLTLDGKLTVAPSLSFDNGIYELFSYGGNLTNHGLDIVSLPGTAVGVVETLVLGQVNLLVTAPSTLVQYWDGADGIGNGVISGGTGTWSTFATNWTEPAPSILNGSWQGGIARFQGTGGVVTLATSESFEGLDFAIDGYSVKATGSAALVTNSNAFIFVANGGTTDISAPIGGTGSFRKLGNGTLNLSGASTYTGGTDLQFGTLGVGSNTALGTGALTIQHATTLAAMVTGLTLANAITTIGSADIDSGAGVFTLAGNVGGAGSIEKIGAGNLVLNGANGFTNLAVLSGTVTLGTSTAAGIGSVNLVGGTKLAAGVAGLVVANAVAVGGGPVAIDSTQGIFTLAGPITGNGSLVSTGTLVLNGANSFNGLAIAAGSVTLGTNTAAGSGIVALAAGTRLAAGVTGLVVANAITTAGVGQLDSGTGLLTLSGNISGAGSIAKVGTGTLLLAGTNSFASAAINSGTLAVGSAGALGTGLLTINTGATLQSAAAGLAFANAMTLVGATTVDTEAFALSLTGIVGGSGSLAKTGSGTLILTAANTYTGGTGLAAGTLAVTNAAALGTGALAITGGTLQAGAAGLTLANAIVTTGAGSVDTQAFAFTLSGATSGAAALTKTGSGTLVLTGAGTRTGTTTIAAGTLNSAVAGLGSGNIVDNGALIFNQAVDASYGSVVSGTGTVTKIGAGNLTLTGTSTVSGATSLTGGRLTVNGALGSTVTAATGTTLAGTGSIAGLVAASGSTVSPGATDLATGTLTVTGNAAFQAGSTLLVNVLPGAADRLTVGGTANLAGNLVLTAGAGQYLFNTSYTLFSSAGARTGTFAAPSLALFGPAFAPTLTYGTNDLVLKLVPNSLVTLLGAGSNSANVLATATAFDRATTAGFNPQAFYNLYLQGAGLGAAINQLTGEIHSADSRQALTDTRHVREAALDRLGAGIGSNGGNDASSRASGETGLAGWARAVGSWGKTDSDGNGARLDIDTKGVLVGIDIASDTWKAGALFNALESKVDTRILGTSKVKTTGGGIYGGYRSAQGFSLAVGASVGGVKTHSSRAITVPGLTQVLTGHTSGTNYQVFGDIAYDLAAAEKTRVEPFVRFAYVAYHVDGLAESGGFAGLVSGKQKYDATFTTLGLRASTELGKSASLRGSLGYQYTGGDRSPIASLSIQGTNQNAGIRSVALDKSAVAAEAGIDYRIGKNSSLGVGYTGVIGKNNSDNGVKATLSVGF